jgi:hypothetical protein
MIIRIVAATVLNESELEAAGWVPYSSYDPPLKDKVNYDEAERLGSEDYDDVLDREAHGFTYEDDWQDESLLCRNGCGLSYREIVAGKIRNCPGIQTTSSADQLAEFAGRNCYQSWDRPNPSTSKNQD